MIAETLTTLVRPHLADLTDADQQLIKTLATHPSAGLFMSARELAHNAGVHQSSAVRLAKKLGFDGYPEFRRALQSVHQRPASGAAVRVARTVSATSDGDVFKRLLAKEVESLLNAEPMVSQASLDAAAQMLAGGARIFIWASGNAKVLADLLDRRLRRAGFAAQNIAFEGRELAERLVPLRSGDVVVVFAFLRAQPGMEAVLRHARGVGAQSLLIADTVAHTLKTGADLTLSAPRGQDDEFLTLTVPMLITNALLLTLAHTDKGRSIAGLQTLDRLYEAVSSNK